MNASTKVDHVINVRITHKTARVSLMEAVTFKDKTQALNALRSLEGVEECIYLQTCNRVEIYLVAEEAQNTLDLAKRYLAHRASEQSQDALKTIETAVDNDAFNHLLRVTSGMESMVIGEDQILNQVWDAYIEADNAKTLGPILKHLFNRAVSVGRKVRSETGINKGAVSVGSAAVELAVKILGNLQDKEILVMGAGEMGTTVAKALAHRCLKPIFIANRTYDRAVKLAEETSGKAVTWEKFDEVMTNADVVICATSAPHYLLTKEILTRLLGHRQNKNSMVIIDISNPRNVEKLVVEVPAVKLYNIDDLQTIADKNKAHRQAAIEKAQDILDEELATLQEDMKSFSVRQIVSELLSDAEQIRRKELATAMSKLGKIDDHQKRVLNDLTAILLKQTYIPLVENLKVAAKNGDKQAIEVAAKLFEKTEKNIVPSNNVSLILIGHGSKLPHNRENLEKLAENLRGRKKFKTVEIAFMIRDSPTVEEAIDTASSKGVSKIVLVPAFLAPGVHTTQDIPGLIGVKEKEPQLQSKGIELVYGEPLGSDERIADILEEKALKALGLEVKRDGEIVDAYSVPEAGKIVDKSMMLIREAIGSDLEKLPKDKVPIVERVVHTMADPEFAHLLEISDDAAKAGVAAIKSGAKVVSDVKMIKAGINDARLKKFGTQVQTYTNDYRVMELAKTEKLTRSAAAMRLAIKDGLDGAIILIGNAPTAALEISKQIKAGKVKPALVVAVPVGFVGAAESKEVVAMLPVPYVITKGRKGGSTIAVAVFNALLTMAEGKQYG